MECVVLAEKDVLTSLDHGAALADNDVSGLYLRPVTTFDTEVLWVRIGEVFGGTACFFRCHGVVMLYCYAVVRTVLVY